MAINTLKLALVAALGMMALMMSLLAISLSVLLVQKQQQLKQMSNSARQLRTTTTTNNNKSSSLLSNVLEQDSSKKKWSNNKTKDDHPLKSLKKLGPQHRHRLSTFSPESPRLAANVHLEHALMYAEEPPPFFRLEDTFHNDPQWLSLYTKHYEAMGVTPYMLHQRQQQRLSAGAGADAEADEGNLIHQSYSTTMSTSAVPSLSSSKKSRSSQNSNFLQEWFYSLYAIDNSIIKVLLGPFASTSGSSSGSSSTTSWFTGSSKKGGDGSSSSSSSGSKKTIRKSPNTNSDVASENDTLALYHLQKAADMGHPLAHYWLGNVYSSSSMSGTGTDNESSHLGKAMIHWHLAAMEGIQEAQMTLGYRYASAYKSSPTDGAGHMMVKSTGNNVVTTTSSSGKTTITITNAGPGGAGTTGSSSGSTTTTSTTSNNSGMDDTFGVVGTCDTALAYYMEAANTAMDEMEFSSLKGKIIPSMDRHRLSDIHMHGSSSTLALHNKPDELPEALEYLRIRATTNSFGGVGSSSSSNGSNYFGGDSQSAVTLANMHHYGMRGVSQDLLLALEYYELAANSALYNDYGKDVVDSWWTNYEQDVASTHEQTLSHHHDKDASSSSAASSLLLAPPAEEYEAYGTSATTTTTTHTATGDDGSDDDDDDEEDVSKSSSKHQKQNHINMFVTDHPDAAGQAAKFYMLGIGHEGYWDITSHDHVVEQHKVWKYCMMGAPGGLKTCSDRESNKDICDAEALNTFGLVYLKGLPALGIEPNVTRAIQYFNLAKEYGSVDALYHLSMMRMGWMNSDHDTDIETNRDEFVQFVHKTSDGEYMIVKKDPMTGHVTIESGSDSSTHFDESDAETSSTEPQNDETLSSSDSTTSSTTSTTPRRTKYDKEYEFRRAMNAKRLITQTEYTRALQDLVRAANKGHLQSMHRVGLMYASGIAHGGKPNCNVALQYLRQVAEQSPAIAQRLRTAYRAYTTLHNPQAALRNYMVAAEAGIELAQSNAAWLLERGYCVSDSSEKCHEMSLKLWMLASKQGNAEASIRVGDYYYYKRLRRHDHDSGVKHKETIMASGGSEKQKTKSQTTRTKPKSVSFWLETEWPFAIYYITHPRQLLLPPLKHWLIQKIRHLLYTLRRVKTIVFKLMRLTTSQSQQTTSTTTSTSGFSSEKSRGTQIVDNNDDNDDENENDDENFIKAAQYYRKAIETHHSARGHYNLAYMYEWGLGLKQDFHLAKRHYDSATTHQKEAQLAISIALAGMHLHEYFVKRYKVFQTILQRHVGELKHYSSSKKDKTDDIENDNDNEHYEEDYYTIGEMLSVLMEYMIFGSFENLSQKERRRRDIYMNHLLSVEVLLVYVLTCVMIWLMMKLWEQQQQSKEKDEETTAINNNNDNVNNNNNGR